MTDPRASLAAMNNADLYQAVFDCRHLRYRRTDRSFMAVDAPPPYYAHMTVTKPLTAGELGDELAVLARHRGGLGVKDSFCRLDLSDHGFSTGFTADWIWRGPMASAMPSGWTILRDSPALLAWEAAWKSHGSPTEGRMFPDAALRNRDLVFLAEVEGHAITAGCLANRSDQCVGLSNVFGRAPSPQLFAAAAQAVSSVFPGVPITGYERGLDLDHALACGFGTVGPLRVLFADSPRFSQ